MGPGNIFLNFGLIGLKRREVLMNSQSLVLGMKGQSRQKRQEQSRAKKADLNKT